MGWNVKFVWCILKVLSSRHRGVVVIGVSGFRMENGFEWEIGIEVGR